ncbi:integrase [Rhizobium sp. WSM1325]|nr:integrase [Rhizobium leguminosarum]RWY64961.1 integrase [Rhizobium leguminosarum]RWY73610.1 integrase [Rhizobium leguminosarum]
MLPRYGCTTSLIPVLVTGIQPRRVCAVNDSHRRSLSLAPKDLGALDPCDEHRDEEGEGVLA